MSESIFFISLGCDKNRIDAEIMAKTLENGGFRLVDDSAEADCAVVNTCGFIESAKQEAIEAIFDMLRIKEDECSRMRAVVVTGCLAQRYCHELSEEIPEVDAVTGIGYNGDICSTIRAALDGEKTALVNEPENLPINGDRFLSTPGHYAYLKIAEGCDNKCTYCAIPGIRGSYRSRPMEDVLKEAETLVESGVRELILVAQDTTLYGSDLGIENGLVRLLHEICKIDDLWKVRILYAYPDRITDDLVNCIALEPKIAKYLDIPMQHANGQVLRRMNRFGDCDTLKTLINKIRAAVPDISLRTTFMVGFPGETEEQYNELLDFAKEMKFQRAGAFAFSSEEGTPAAKLREDLTEEDKAERRDILMTMLTSQLADERQSWIGKRVETVCEGFDQEQGMFVLRSEYDAPEVDTVIYALGEKLPELGDVVLVEIVDADEYDLFGRIV